MESFADFLTKFKTLAKQAYGDKANEITETFLFSKLPIQIQNELAMAGKHEATSGKIRTFVQRRCQYAQLLPSNSVMQPLNNLQNYPVRQQAKQQTATTNNPGGNQLQTKRSNENSKATVDIATLSVKNGLTAENVSGTKPTELTPTPTNALNQTITTNSPRPTNLDTTQSSCAKSVEKLSTLHETAEIESQVPQRTRMYPTRNSLRQRTESSAGTSDNPKIPDNHHTRYHK